MMNCPNCGKEIKEDWRTCPYCSKPINGKEQDKKSSMFKKAGIAFGVLVILAMAWSFSSDHKTSSDISSNTSPIVEKKAEIKSWHLIREFKGTGTKNTETFTIPSDEWQIAWDTKPGQYGPMNFQIYIKKPNNQLVNVAANVVGSNADTSYFREKGDYYLMINSGQPYYIRVEAKY